ncbi:MAG: 3-deoxy-manno-octulosonate cytidylyltransferase [Candidatus Omnitrophica bacterium]|nr:3-deoxy-manno-octulosonate cytidylyltransferase [Candidatus Omnitrophota bacterium]
MEVIGVIPARWASSRFEGKVLADIHGKPMLQHVWERSKGALLLDDLIIACDDERVAKVAHNFGAKVVMTSKGHLSGSDRISEVVYPLDVRIVVNIQADEPMIRPVMIDEVTRPLLEDTSIFVSTLIKRIEDPEEIKDPNIVKVVIDEDNFALYFSRAVIPYRALNSEIKQLRYYKHLGLYAYTKDFLFTFRNLPPSYLEKIERLEQLRILENGFRIKTVETKFDTIGVDTPEDLEKVRKYWLSGEKL